MLKVTLITYTLKQLNIFYNVNESWNGLKIILFNHICCNDSCFVMFLMILGENNDKITNYHIIMNDR